MIILKMQTQSNISVEKTSLQVQTGFGYKMDIPHNYVIYFEKEQNISFNLYIRNNFDLIEDQFATLGLKFIYLPFLTQSIAEINTVLEYYLPSLSYIQVQDKLLSDYKEKIIGQMTKHTSSEIRSIILKEEFVPDSMDYSEVLALVNYQGCANSGLLCFDPMTCVIGESDIFIKSEQNKEYSFYFNDVIAYLKQLREEEEDFDYMPFCPLPVVDYTEQLDESAKEVISSIEAKLSELKDSGQLLFLIPILKNLLEKQSQSINLNSISRLEVNYHNRILLPYFKKEVELSYLTKAVYFLFLKHPEGINLKELGNYQKELLSIYTSVSNQLDYDKMVKSVEDVVNLETKAIYTHLSRIKSAYYKIMDESFAKYYIVSGNGEEDRKVLFDTTSIVWDSSTDLLKDFKL
jgi:hypothetical protein